MKLRFLVGYWRWWTATAVPIAVKTIAPSTTQSAQLSAEPVTM